MLLAPEFDPLARTSMLVREITPQKLNSLHDSSQEQTARVEAELHIMVPRHEQGLSAFVSCSGFSPMNTNLWREKR